jgi:hypothetical protein
VRAAGERPSLWMEIRELEIREWRIR